MHDPSRLGLAAACLAVILASPCQAQFQPNVKPELEVSRARGPIVIDGNLDDAGWVGTAQAVNWSQTWPADNVESAFGQQAWITYDAENLYIAFVVDDASNTLRASFRDRDEVWRDDYVGIIFDTYGSGAWAYELFFNPRGIQMDLRWTQNGEDMGFDVIHESEGRITETGWQVEVAIPFQSLRFPDRVEQVWRATFWHNRPRESRERYSWAAGNRDDPCWPCNWGTLTGISGVSGGGALEFLPSVTAFDGVALEDEEDPGSRYVLDEDFDAGIGVRYAISSSWAAEATFNPDFSQVESDAAQIDANTTFALFFPERRPFFQEGSDLYSSYVNAIYTRSINNPEWAAKLTGRSERFSGALLVAQDELTPLLVPFATRSALFALDRSWSTVARGRRALLDDSFVGALSTTRVLEGGGFNTVNGLDLSLRTGVFQLEAQWLVSQTEEPDLPGLDGGDLDGRFSDDDYTRRLDGETFSGEAGYFSVERNGRHWFSDVDYWRTSPTFRADNGFITQNDTQRLSWINQYSTQTDNDVFDDINGFLMIARVWNYDGLRVDEWIRPEINLQFKSQTSVELGYLYSNENFRDVELADINRYNIEVDTHFSEALSGGVEYEWGDFPARRADPIQLGDGQRIEVGLNLQPMDRLAIAPSFEWQRLARKGDGNTHERGFFEGYVTRTRLDLQFTRRLFLRTVFQYDDFDRRIDIEPLLTYRINPFTVVYAGSAYRLQDFGDRFDDFGVEDVERQYFAKLQYFFRR